MTRLENLVDFEVVGPCMDDEAENPEEQAHFPEQQCRCQTKPKHPAPHEVQGETDDQAEYQAPGPLALLGREEAAEWTGIIFALSKRDLFEPHSLVHDFDRGCQP